MSALRRAWDVWLARYREWSAPESADGNGCFCGCGGIDVR